MPDLPAFFEVGSIIVLVAILAADLLIVTRRPHIPTMKESGLWVSLYVALAVLTSTVVDSVDGDAADAEVVPV